MANAPKNLDKLFEEKLSHHEIKPSQLAWERLENQLPKKQKEPKTYWWAAAAVILVLVASYSIFQSTDQTENGDFVADQNTQVIEESNESSNTNVVIEEEAEPDMVIETPEVKEVENAPAPVTKKKEDSSTKPIQYLAVNTPEEKEEVQEEAINNREIVEEPVRMTFDVERPLIAEAPLEINVIETAESSVAETPNESTSYKLTIISDGIKDTPNKNLIAGLGKRVNQVEGFLGKAGQGLGDLQDKKDDFFNNLISKKGRPTEKP